MRAAPARLGKGVPVEGLHSKYTLSVLATLRWLLFTGVPAGLFAVLVYRTDRNREPPWLVALTFALGSFAGLAVH